MRSPSWRAASVGSASGRIQRCCAVGNLPRYKGQLVVSSGRAGPLMARRRLALVTTKAQVS